MRKTALLKLLTAMLALTMVLGTLALCSCADEQTENDNDGNDQTPGDGNENDGQDRLPLELPDVKYDNASINILEWTCGNQTDVGYSWIPWEEGDVDAINGDLLNDAIYTRNALVEEIYGLVITKNYLSLESAYGTALRGNNTSGDDEFQMMTIRSLNVTTFILENLMTDMNDLQNVHTDKIWWNQDSVASFTLGESLYFAAPEMLLRDKGAAAAMYYNAQVAADHNITDLYDLVKAGEWTWEAYIDYGERVTVSLDDDDLQNSTEDMWGMIGSDSDVFRLFSGSGIKFASINDDGFLTYNFGDDDSILTMQEVFEDIIYSDYFCHNGLVDFKGASTVSPFMNNHGLFAIQGVRALNDLRSMETAYGVLPIPKYSEAQEEYASLVWVHDDSVLGIPGAVKDKEMAALAVEALSYYSWYDVYPKFYDTVILGRSTRDEQSKEMLGIVFKSRLYDPGQFWDSGTGASGIQNKLLRLPITRESNIGSIWGSYEDAVKIRIDDINTIIEESMW